MLFQRVINLSISHCRTKTIRYRTSVYRTQKNRFSRSWITAQSDNKSYHTYKSYLSTKKISYTLIYK